VGCKEETKSGSSEMIKEKRKGEKRVVWMLNTAVGLLYGEASGEFTD
jgi:hypothetical protein